MLQNLELKIKLSGYAMQIASPCPKGLLSIKPMSGANPAVS